MRMLHVIASLDPVKGGPCQVILNSIPALESLGIQNEVLCVDDPASAFLKNLSFRVHALGDGQNAWRYSSKVLPWLYKNLYRFDIITIHGLWLYTGYAVIKAILLLKKQQRSIKCECYKIPKVYIMTHGMLDPYFQRASGRKLKAIRNWIYWKLIESNVINNADGLLFTCEIERELAKMSFRPYRPKQEINVGFGIAEPPVFNKSMQADFWEKCPEVKGFRYLLFLGRIHEKKGVDLLIRSYINVAEKFIRRNQYKIFTSSIPAQALFECFATEVKLVIAGPGLETTYGQKMQQLVGESDFLKDYVLFPGMLTGNAKWGAFYGCEAFILPSHQENFGIAVVEALACRKPVLISNQVNIWREIQNEGGGIIADDNLEGTKKMLKSWFSQTMPQKETMSEQAYAAYKKHFEVSKASNDFIRAINFSQNKQAYNA